MWTSLLIIALAATPSALQESVDSLAVDQKLDVIADWLGMAEAEAVPVVVKLEKLENATSRLLKELDSVRSRQAVAGAIQGAQVFLFLAYLATIAVCYLVKRCRKHQKEIAKAEFELLETKLQASRSRRRAAAAARTNKQTSQ